MTIRLTGTLDQVTDIECPYCRTALVIHTVEPTVMGIHRKTCPECSRVFLVTITVAVAPLSEEHATNY